MEHHYSRIAHHETEDDVGPPSSDATRDERGDKRPPKIVEGVDERDHEEEVMDDFEDYKSVRLLVPEPIGEGGRALNHNFRVLADQSGGYTHRQTVPSAHWQINHGLRKPVAVTVVDDQGDQMIGDLRIVDMETVTVDFSRPYTGTVYVV